ncbi:metalloendopeptidase [Aureococcus anophagefferens]|nr:metalloendopeptidase [Aureococcus anophagefferens]
MYGDQYKEIVVEDGEMRVERVGPHDCHYAGPASRVRADGSVERGAASASLCAAGALSAVIRYDGGGVHEVGWDRGAAAHVLFDPIADKRRLGDDERRYECGVNDQFIKDQEARFGRDPHRRLADRDHHDHDDHDHPDALLSRNRRSLAGGCENGASKYASVVFFNDASRHADHGASVEAHSAEIFDVVRAIYEDAVNPNDGLYDGETFDCVVRPRLVGQVTWRGANPAKVEYKTPRRRLRDCGSSASNGNFCFGGEVSSYCLLTSFSSYVGEKQDELEALLGAPLDNAMLLTSEDFSGGTMGHNWGMGHDDEDSDNLMSPYVKSGEPSAENVRFSPASRAGAASFMAGDYGTWTDLCLETEEAVTWDRPVCGDGVVDPGEDCDAAGVPCRAAADAACDVAEACTGASGLCPPDLSLARGAGCADSDASVGVCYGGECLSWGHDFCKASSGMVAKGATEACASSTCDRGACREPGGTSCWSYGVGGGPLRDGLPCDGGFCVDQACATEALHAYHWYRGETDCDAPVCRDETGAAASDGDCGGLAVPAALARCADAGPAPASAPTLSLRAQRPGEPSHGAAAAAPTTTTAPPTREPTPRPTPRPTPAPSVAAPEPTPSRPRPRRRAGGGGGGARRPLRGRARRRLRLRGPRRRLRGTREEDLQEHRGLRLQEEDVLHERRRRARDSKKTCKNTAGCAYKKKTCSTSEGDACSGLEKKACKKTDGCDYKKKQCSAASSCSGLSKKKCKKTDGCKYKKESETCKAD